MFNPVVYPPFVRGDRKGKLEEKELIRAFLEFKEELNQNLNGPLTEKNWEEVLNLLEDLLNFYFLLIKGESPVKLSEKGIGFDKTLLDKLSNSIAKGDALYLEIIAIANLFLSYPLEDLFKLIKGKPESVRWFIRISVEWGNTLSALKLYKAVDKSFNLAVDTAFALTVLFRKLQTCSFEILDWEIPFLIESLKDILEQESGELNTALLLKLTHPIIDLPLILKPSRETLKVGVLLKDIVIRFSNEIYHFFKEVVDKELPENALKPQLPYVLKALVDFLVKCGLNFDLLYVELLPLLNRFQITKEDFKKLKSDISEREIILWEE